MQFVWDDKKRIFFPMKSVFAEHSKPARNSKRGTTERFAHSQISIIAMESKSMNFFSEISFGREITTYNFDKGFFEWKTSLHQQFCGFYKSDVKHFLNWNVSWWNKLLFMWWRHSIDISMYVAFFTCKKETSQFDLIKKRLSGLIWKWKISPECLHCGCEEKSSDFT